MPQTRAFMNSIFESRRFATLLFAQLLALFVLPLMSGPDNEGAVFNVSIAIVLGAGLYAAASRRGARIVAVLLLLPTAFAWIGPDLFSGQIDSVMRMMTLCACLVFTAFVVLASLSSHQQVTRETLLGGVNVYLLLIFAFTVAHASIEIVNPGSYTVGGRPLLEHVDAAYAGHAFPTIVYFSVTTLSTLGYGDIIPATESARMLTSFEAIIGPLYLAIFIGRLVGIQVGERTAEREIELRSRAQRDETAGP